MMTILPPYIIEELQRIEEERQRQLEDDLRPRLYIHVPQPMLDDPYCDTGDEEPGANRGIIIIDLNNNETLEA
jgi:hypothetical protein